MTDTVAGPMAHGGAPHAVDLDDLAQCPHLLVACDYDGTIAPIVDDPSAAPPMPEAISALRALAALPNTSVAVISGRALRDLALMSRLPREVHLVGSHGSEIDAGFAQSLPVERRAMLDDIVMRLERIVEGAPGARLELKPASVALHVRHVERALAPATVERAVDVAHALGDVQVRHGHEVVELSVVRTDKGEALNRIRHVVGATAVLFIGDDQTDEDAFATLSGPDLGIRVGDGPTCARARVPSPVEVAVTLAWLGELRHQWLFGAAATPIERHTLLSDQRTAALVTSDGRVTWLCHPRLDSAAVFAELVGGPGAGYFSVTPSTGAGVIGHRYLSRTMVAETRWPDLTVVDYLDCSSGRFAQAPGSTNLVRVLTGTGQANVEFAPRPGFAGTPVQLRPTRNGLEVLGSADGMVLRSPGVQWKIVADGHHQVAHASIALGPTPVVLELVLGAGDEEAMPEVDRRAASIAFWSDWADALVVPAVAPELVVRSALTIRALCHGPTGAIAAAGTTSLPEELGGIRNWDYRYCWIRDAALAATALARLGSHHEALDYLAWVGRLLEGRSDPEHLRPVYALDGTDLSTEAVLFDLSGYAGSRPVRVGNAADHQVQLDVFGPVADLLDVLDRRRVALTAAHLALLEALVNAVLRRWDHADHGIWEERIAPKHHVHSRVMCWVTLDRALSIWQRGRREHTLATAAIAAVESTRDRIAGDVLVNGWNDTVGAFTKAYGSSDLDAAVLHIGLSGLLPGDDPRFASTVNAIEKTLRDGPIVRRYLHDDGLPGNEGGFVVCALWLVDSYVLLGRLDDAEELFELVCDLAGPTGLLAEQVGRGGVALGNFPQTYSHHGLIDSALRLSAARAARAPLTRNPIARLRERRARRNETR
jgi:trehalose 6-phosphate phosphatase